MTRSSMFGGTIDEAGEGCGASASVAFSGWGSSATIARCLARRTGGREGRAQPRVVHSFLGFTVALVV